MGQVQFSCPHEQFDAMTTECTGGRVPARQNSLSPPRVARSRAAVTGDRDRLPIAHLPEWIYGDSQPGPSHPFGDGVIRLAINAPCHSE